MEFLKLIDSLLTPLSIAVVGYFIQRTLAEQNRNWKVQERIADKRVEIYERVAVDLNRIYCYVMDIGDFKDQKWEAIILAKRNVDRNMFMYQAIWSVDTFQCYENYMLSAFAIEQGAGKDAKIRTRTHQKKEALKKKSENSPGKREHWPDSWDINFTEEQDSEHSNKYRRLMTLISRDLMHSNGSARVTGS